MTPEQLQDFAIRTGRNYTECFEDVENIEALLLDEEEARKERAGRNTNEAI